MEQIKNKITMDYAQIAYKAYGVSVGGKNYQGLDMPQWEDLPQKIRDAWNAAIISVFAEMRMIRR